MTLKQARTVRDLFIKHDIGATVPWGYGPDGYFARIWTARWSTDGSAQPHDFEDMKAARSYIAAAILRRRRAIRDFDRTMVPRRPRTPIEMMIDRACGLG